VSHSSWRTARRSSSFSFYERSYARNIDRESSFLASIRERSFCNTSALFNCDISAFDLISQLGGVPLGYCGLHRELDGGVS
jgi:hypothetical protein